MPIGTPEKKKDSVIRLTERQRARLDQIAGSLHCHSGSGPSFGLPSWRVMVAGIADGVLIVRNPRDPAARAERKERRKKRREKKALATNSPGLPDWWKPWYGNAMGQEYALKASGLTFPELLALGLRAEFCPSLTNQEVLVGRPEWPAPFSKSRPHWWWAPIEDGTMLVADAVASSGLPVETLTAAGMVVTGEWISPPAAWNGWKIEKKGESHEHP